MTCFAAALPQPAHQLPGSALATGIRDAILAANWVAHCREHYGLGHACRNAAIHQGASKRPAANQMSAAESVEESTTCGAVSPDVNRPPTGKGPAKGQQTDAPDLELVALLRSMVLEVLTPPPVAELLPVHAPACAGGRWCVKAEDLARFAGSELGTTDFVTALLGWGGHPVRVPWRLVRAWGALGKVEGGIWLTLEEVKAALPYLPGSRAVKLRRLLA